jgi:hypothetical protein
MSVNSIDSDQYVDGSIDSAHLAADVVTGAKIADDAIDSEHYTDGSIDSVHLAADVVTGAKIADDAIDSEHYVDGSIDNAHIADDAIDSEHYAAGSIDTAHIADDQVTLAKMAGITRGSIIIGNSSGDPAALALGTNDYVLTSDGTDIAWEAASSFNADAAQTFNDSGADVDFRIESDDNANMFFVDGGSDTIGIGTGSPTSTYGVHVKDVGNGTHQFVVENTSSSAYPEVVVKSDTHKWSMATGGSSTATAYRENFYIYDHDAAVQRLVIGDAGQLAFSTDEGWGSDGQVLTSTGASSAPAWENASGGGVTGLTGLVENNSIWLGIDPTSTTDTAEYNVALGTGALDAITTGDKNIAIGYNAMTTFTEGRENTVIGYLAGDAMTTGQLNTFVGSGAGGSLTEGLYNVCVGGASGETLTTTHYNTFVGYGAGYQATNQYSVALGFSAMYGSTGGSCCVSIGSRAGYSNAAGGDHNCLVGYQTGYYISTGDDNTMLGNLNGIASGPGTSLTTGHRNVLIGAWLDCSAADVTDEIVIGSGGSYAAGLVGKGTDTVFISSGGGNSYNGANTTVWVVDSDERLKKNIVDSTVGLAEINQIQVRNFEYRLPEEVDEELASTTAIKKEGVQTGVIAQEIMDIFPDIVTQETTGVYALDADSITWHLVKAVQELTARIEELEGE